MYKQHLIHRRGELRRGKKTGFSSRFSSVGAHHEIHTFDYYFTHKTSRERWRTTRKFTRLQQ